MRAAQGDDPVPLGSLPSPYSCGTPYARDYGASAMRGDMEAAKRLLGESSYKGETTVVINPTGLPVDRPARTGDSRPPHPDRLQGGSSRERLGHGGAAPDQPRTGREGRLERLPLLRQRLDLCHSGDLDARSPAGQGRLVRLAGRSGRRRRWSRTGSRRRTSRPGPASPRRSGRPRWRMWPPSRSAGSSSRPRSGRAITGVLRGHRTVSVQREAGLIRHRGLQRSDPGHARRPLGRFVADAPRSDESADPTPPAAAGMLACSRTRSPASAFLISALVSATP